VGEIFSNSETLLISHSESGDIILVGENTTKHYFSATIVKFLLIFLIFSSFMILNPIFFKY